MSYLETRISGETIVFVLLFRFFFALFWFYSAIFQDAVTISSIVSNLFWEVLYSNVAT